VNPTSSADPARIPGVYVWEPPGKSIAVNVSLDVVDRLQQDVMKGFGAVPKRGAEVGGILLGHITRGEKLTVTVDDYEQIEIPYKRGPSYLLSEEDASKFQEVVVRARERHDPLLHPIGYFRSHTRDSAGLGPEDLAITHLHFSEPEAVVLLIRPFATKVSQAGFYFRENGAFQSGLPLLEFPFRRRELDGGANGPVPMSRARGGPSRQPAPAIEEADPQPAEPRRMSRAMAQHAIAEAPETAAAPPTGAESIGIEFAPETRRKRGGEVWVPLSFIFLLLGLLLGFLAATMTIRPQLPARSNDPYNINLAVAKQGSDLLLRWDRNALATRTAARGSLTIEDGSYQKIVSWTSQDLQNGSVVYPPITKHVKFRLEVVLNGRDSLVETVEWQEPPQ